MPATREEQHMSTKTSRMVFILPILVPTLLAACSRQSRDLTVTVDGSSTVFPISRVVADEFEKRNPVKVSVTVPVGISGTHGGFLKFCDGQTDIANASRPINHDEEEHCARNRVDYIEVPIGYDGLTVLVNPKNTWANEITTAELKAMWEPTAERRVTRWSQVRQGWPDRELHLYGPGADSGTYDYFTAAIVGQEHSSRTDYQGSENDDEIVDAIVRDELALGFFGYAYLYKNQGRVKGLAVDDGNADNGAGPIAPSPETVQNGSYQPLSRPLFIYVNKRSLERREVELFVGYYLSKAASFVARVGYVPFSEESYRTAHQRIIARQTGSIFNGAGSRVGLGIEQLLQRERAEARLEPMAPSQGK
jgi:phosphate transport system substrate-binding protein